MDNKTLNQLQKTVNEVLDVSHRFMKICNDKFDRGFIGELLVLRQLLKMHHKELSLEGNEIKYLGNFHKGWDIELILNKKITKIDAKATKVHVHHKPRWVHQSGTKYFNIGDKNGKANITPKKEYADNLFYYFVNVKTWIESNKVNIYVLSDAEAGRRFIKTYKKIHGVQKRKSDDMIVEYEDIKDCEVKPCCDLVK